MVYHGLCLHFMGNPRPPHGIPHGACAGTSHDTDGKSHKAWTSPGLAGKSHDKYGISHKNVTLVQCYGIIYTVWKYGKNQKSWYVVEAIRLPTKYYNIANKVYMWFSQKSQISDFTYKFVTKFVGEKSNKSWFFDML